METAQQMTPKTLSWFDHITGHQIAKPEKFGDVVIARADISVSYHLSVVVDDALDGINLVTRGNDLAQFTHLHRLLQVLLGLPVPEYCHHVLVRDVTMDSHPAYTGEKRFVDTAGRVEKFQSKFSRKR